MIDLHKFKEKCMEWEKSEMVRLLKGDPGNFYQEADTNGKTEIRNWLTEVLNSTDVNVVFTKADGSLREMKCTLRADQLPPAKPIAETKQRKPQDPETIRVFDLEKSEWRSFRFDRVRQIKLTLTQ
jgi:hypothetical protein